MINIENDDSVSSLQQAPLDILKKYWGYQQFRPMQQEIINSILDKKDTLALMPTGGGKSICFQVPALCNDGLCLVISPLIALMKDQVHNLKKKGIPALSIYSGMDYVSVKKTLQNAAYGNFKFLYVSPERLETDLFLSFLPAININLLAIDEAHCISQWGYDFRPPYMRIASIREVIKGVPVMALTASATKEVQQDICKNLSFKKGYSLFQTSFERPNLSYSVFDIASKQNKVIDILKKVAGSGIIYCKTRRRTKEVAELLELHGIKADYYHAGLAPGVRSAKQEAWIQNSIRIIACTNAFGMGIDKPDVRTVIHYDVPDALENYYQEAGRAGRDGKKSYAVLLYRASEVEDLKRQVALRFPSSYTIRNIYQALVNYFQLPTGSGEGLKFDFDINDFVKKFKLDVVVVNNALKILEQEQVVQYSEQFFSPATAVFDVDKYSLQEFEKSNPLLEPVIKGLLRSYDGIFDYPAQIKEGELASFLSVKITDLKSLLIELKNYGIIQYTAQKDTPQIIFLDNRAIASNLIVNEQNILKRKGAFEGRLSAMIRYLGEENSCRTEMIANYFGDHNVSRCEVCDNCLRQKVLSISSKEFQILSNRVEELISEGSITRADFFAQFNGTDRKKIKEVLSFYLKENLITVSEQGVLSWNK
ncbi:MAG: ATP-dependent DNA helicase RecQ [Ginsengibacter sp.]